MLGAHHRWLHGACHDDRDDNGRAEERDDEHPDHDRDRRDDRQRRLPTELADPIEPERGERAGRNRMRSGAEDLHDRRRERNDRGGHRHREQTPDAEQGGAGRHHNEDQRGMDLYTARVHPAIHESNDDRLGADDEDQEEDGGRSTFRRDADKQDHGGCEDRSEVQDEAADEDEHGERTGEWHAQMVSNTKWVTASPAAVSVVPRRNPPIADTAATP